MTMSSSILLQKCAHLEDRFAVLLPKNAEVTLNYDLMAHAHKFCSERKRVAKKESLT